MGKDKGILSYFQQDITLEHTLFFSHSCDENVYTDAEILSSELQITLTKKEFGKGQVHLLAGIPFHSLDKHLPILVEKGFRIAICEQIGLEPNSQGIIDRKVVRVVSPGTIFEDYLLDNNSNNYLLCCNM